MSDIQNFTYHCHTTFSDGKNSIEEMIDKALALGFSSIGISDHLTVHKNLNKDNFYSTSSTMKIFHNSFDDILESYQRHCDEIREIAKKKRIKVLIGFEVDFFTYDGWLEEFKDFVSKLDYDYLISGNHMLFNEDCERIIEINNSCGQRIDYALLQQYINNHFATIMAAIDSKMFSFIAHLDYIRKIGTSFYNENNFIDQQNKIALKLSSNNVGAEISTKGLRKLDYFYPSLQWLKILASEDVAMIISDDAHTVDELGYRFDFAEETLKQVGVQNRLKLQS